MSDVDDGIDDETRAAIRDAGDALFEPMPARVENRKQLQPKFHALIGETDFYCGNCV